ncbi:MAG: 6-carboxytetrahydropterin synthase [Candidatus Latescibacterota bacterium]|nr:MAG: 6-carboxytetrahydropterin synthase [Candidatus Latescibacterota bacterium]
MVSRFNAAHTLWNPSFTEEENIKTFGECANPAGHGHRYTVEITVGGGVTSDKPYVVPRPVMRKIVDDVLSPKLRNANLNVVFGNGFLPTGENVAKALWHLLEPAIEGHASLVSVRIVETQKNSFVYAGEVGPDIKTLPI